METFTFWRRKKKDLPSIRDGYVLKGSMVTISVIPKKGKFVQSCAKLFGYTEIVKFRGVSIELSYGDELKVDRLNLSDVDVKKNRTRGLACWVGHANTKLEQRYSELALPKMVLDYHGGLPDDCLVVPSAGKWHIPLDKNNFPGTIKYRKLDQLDYIGNRENWSNTRLNGLSSLAVDPGLPMAISSNSDFSMGLDANVVSALDVPNFSDVLLPGALLDFVNNLGSVGMTVGQVLSEAINGVASHATLIMPALRVYAYYTQKLKADHNSRRTYDRSLSLPAPALVKPIENFDVRAALRPYLEFYGSDCRTAIDPNLFVAKAALKGFSDENSGQRALLQQATTQALEIANPNSKLRLFLSNDVGEVNAGLIAKRFPEFSVVMSSTRHVHGVESCVRHAFMAITSNEINTRDPDAYIRTIGATPSQVCRIGNVVHADSPMLSGRDEFRFNQRASSVDREYASLVSHNCKFQECDHAYTGSVVVAPFSVGDISLADFAKSMIKLGSKSAFVMINLPVPLLDRRVTVYRDEWTGCLFERHGESIRMYHTEGASAGYVNDYNATMSWCSPPPRFKGFHVQVEEHRRFGTMFLLEVMIGFGEQELTPTMWRVTDEPFYILPTAIPKWREPETRWFVVPQRRFDNLVEFAMSPGSTKDIRSLLATKVRGQQAEIKIGGHVIEPRWEMDADEFNAIIMHTIIAAEMKSHDFDHSMSCFKSNFRWAYVKNGSFGKIYEFIAYLHDLFTLNLTGNKGPLSRGFFGNLWDLFLGKRFDHTQLWDFYSPQGEYRVINLENSDHAPCIIDDWVALKNMAYATGRKLMTTDWRLYFDRLKYVIPDKPEYMKVTPKRTPEPVASSSSSSSESDYYGTSVVNEPVGVPDVIAEETAFVVNENQVAVVNKAKVAESDDEEESYVGIVAEPEHRNDNVSILNSDFNGCSILDMDDTTGIYTDSVFDPRGDFTEKEVQSQCSAQFWSEFVSFDHMVKGQQKSFFAPDSGMLHMMSELDRLFSDQTMDVPMSNFDAAFEYLKRETDKPDELSKLITKFYSSEISPLATKAFITLNGVAGSAKSSIVREYIKGIKAYNSLVVVPTRKLAEDWMSKSTIYRVVTQHNIGKVSSRPPYIIIDEVYSLDINVLTLWLRYANLYGSKVILLGEDSQRYVSTANSVDFIDDASNVVVNLAVSNTMPIDAVYLSRNLLDTKLSKIMQTRSSIVRSIYFCDLMALPTFVNKDFTDQDGLLTARSTDGRQVNLPYSKSLSIAQSQGSRFDNTVCAFDYAHSVTRWLQSNPNSVYVAISRHSKTCLIGLTMMESMAVIKMKLTEVGVAVNGYAKDDQANVFGVDVIIETDDAPDVVNAAAIQLSDTVAFSERFVKIGKKHDDWTPDNKVKCDVSIQEIEDFISRYSQHDSLFDHGDAFDMIIPKTGSLYSLSSQFEIKVNDATRSDIIGCEKLAVHQLGSNTFDDLRNVSLRQTSTDVKLIPEGQLINEISLAYKLFKRNYLKSDFTTKRLIPDASAWLKTRSSSYLVSLLSGNTAYCEAGFTTRHQAFLKTQDKVKPEPGFSGALTHGQTVIASDASYNAFFGPSAKWLIENIKDMVRDDVVIDVGYSDRDLGRILREKGMSQNFYDENVQIDISRQDSSHSAVSLGVFALICIDAGLPEDLVNHYVERRSRFSFKSMHPKLYSGSLRFNLPSGDPFTLVCNCIQEMTAVCERFDVSKIASLHKGDDSIFACKSLQPRAGHVIQSLRDVTLKISYGLPAYHAGRFILKDDIVVDYVRRFLKHFAKGDNPSVSNQELYLAALDWNLNLSEFTYRYLVHAGSAVYSDFSLPDLDLMLRTVDKLRDVSFFNSTYPNGKKWLFSNGVIEYDNHCAYNLAMHLFPNADASYYERFINADKDVIYELFSRRFNGRVFKHNSTKDRRLLRPGIHVEPDHVYLVY